MNGEEVVLTGYIVAVLHYLLQQVGGDPLAGSELAIQLCKLVIPRFCLCKTEKKRM